VIFAPARLEKPSLHRATFLTHWWRSALLDVRLPLSEWPGDHHPTQSDAACKKGLAHTCFCFRPPACIFCQFLKTTISTSSSKAITAKQSDTGFVNREVETGWIRKICATREILDDCTPDHVG
jgi:hypothetical protein